MPLLRLGDGTAKTTKLLNFCKASEWRRTGKTLDMHRSHSIRRLYDKKITKKQN